jgi:hypothetical protein
MEGFAIRGTSGGLGAITVATPGCDYLEVSDGHIQNFTGDGIDSGGARVLDCFDLNIDNCGRGIIARGSCVIEACHITRCVSHGISWEPTNIVSGVCAVDECEFRSCGGHGLNVAGDWSTGTATLCISDCDCVGNMQDGIRLTIVSSGGGAGGLAGSICDCRCSANGGFGHRGSVAGSAGTAGARCSLQIEDCICTNNALGGMRLFALRCDLMDCECSDNLGHGIMLDTVAGSVDGCTASGNAGAGLCLQAVRHASVCDCAAHSNSGPGILADPACTGLSITECDCHHNSSGFQIDGQNNLLVWNTASGNGVNYAVGAATPIVVITPAQMPANTNPHANYSF